MTVAPGSVGDDVELRSSMPLVMHDDDETVRAAMARTNGYLRRWWLVCGVFIVLVVIVAAVRT